MKFLFNKEKAEKGFLGVDIGASGIKIAEIQQRKGRFHLYTFGVSKYSKEKDRPPLEDAKAVGEMLKTLCQNAGTVSTKVVSSLPVSHIFSTIITVPPVKDEKELKPIIEAQVRKLTPLPVEEMILDSKIIDPIESSQSKDKNLKDVKSGTRVFVTGAAKTLVQKYVEIFSQAKLELVALETESLALVRSLVGNDKATTMIVDIGAKRTNLVIIEKGVPFLTRSINIGGGILTERLARQIGVSAEDAETIKRELHNTQWEKIPDVVNLSLQPILNEIKFSLEEYARQELNDTKKVEKIILTGGSSRLPGIAPFLSEKLNINTYLGDPWARVMVPDELKSLFDELGPEMSIAVGLAMR